VTDSSAGIRTRRQGWLEALGLLLIVYSGMNLNGIMQFATGTLGFLSPLILGISVVVIVACASRQLVGDAYIWFSFFMLAYSLGGLLPLASGGELDSSRLIAYIGTVIYCSAVYFFIAQRGCNGLQSALAVLQILFFFDCVAVLNDGLIVSYFGIERPEERASGFFDNPNEAAVMALYFLVIIATTATRLSLATVLKFAVALAALLLTFSKTGMLLFFFLTGAFLLARRLYGILAVALVSMLALYPVIQFIVSVNPLGMTDEQVLRIEQVVDIFSGEVDNKTTTGRVELWSIGLERISKTIPLGSGIGSYHRMEGSGHLDLAGDWLGVHNTYLMVLGESGLIPFLILLGFLFVLIRTSLSGAAPLTMAGFLVVFISDMFVTHGVLTLRLHNLILAIMMAAGLQSRSSDKVTEQSAESRLIRSRGGQSAQPRPMR